MMEPIEDVTLTAVRAPRRRASGVLAGVATLALIGAVAACQPPQDRPGAGGSTDDATTASDEPTTGDPSADPSDDAEPGEPGDWSDAVFPECGDTFTLPERSSQLVVTEGPGETVGAGGSFMTVVQNMGSADIQGDVALPQTVVVDADGLVVATVSAADEVFWGAEGGIHMAVAGGESLPFRVSESWTCDGEPVQLGSGEYEVYVLLTVGQVGANDPAQLEQAQGGPFPMVVDESVEGVQTPPTSPEGAVPWASQCGDTWSAPEVTPGFELELLDQIESPRAVTDEIDGGSRLTVGPQVSGSIYNDVVLLRDGKVVSAPVAGDSQFEYYLSAGSEVDLPVLSSLIDCEGMTASPGQYQAVVVTLLTQWTGTDSGVATSIVAATDPVDLVLE